MIKLLRRIWVDISHGDNIDAYTTIAIALVLSIINLLGMNQGQAIPGITLAVLALLAISSLVSRYRLEDLSMKISPSIDSVFLSEFPKDIQEDIETASELWLFGGSLDGVASENYSLFERKIKMGHTIKVLVTDPYSPHVLQISEMRAYGNPNVERAHNQIIGTLSDFCEIRKLASQRLQIRTIDFPVPCRMFVINPNSSKAKILISYYPFKTPGGSLPKYIIHAKDQKWFEHYIAEAKNLWEAGDEYNSEKEIASR